MIDIDNFKKINDTYGHDVGDEVLKFLSQNLIKYLRQSDVIARLGGEEFAVLLPDSNIEHAKNKAEDIRKNIERLEIKLEDETVIKFTVSIGVSSYDLAKGSEFNALLKKSDEALYKAKESGRNTVVVQL